MKGLRPPGARGGHDLRHDLRHGRAFRHADQPARPGRHRLRHQPDRPAYVWGGNGPGQGDVGFDCSGLITAAYATAGVGLPRTAHTQFLATRHLAPESLQPGGLVFYGNPSTKIHHVGLYIGNG